MFYYFYFCFRPSDRLTVPILNVSILELFLCLYLSFDISEYIIYVEEFTIEISTSIEINIHLSSQFTNVNFTFYLNIHLTQVFLASAHPHKIFKWFLIIFIRLPSTYIYYVCAYVFTYNMYIYLLYFLFLYSYLILIIHTN